MEVDTAVSLCGATSLAMASPSNIAQNAIVIIDLSIFFSIGS
jgi:hypothetical protein